MNQLSVLTNKLDVVSSYVLLIMIMVLTYQSGDQLIEFWNAALTHVSNAYDNWIVNTSLSYHTL